MEEIGKKKKEQKKERGCERGKVGGKKATKMIKKLNIHIKREEEGMKMNDRETGFLGGYQKTMSKRL